MPSIISRLEPATQRNTYWLGSVLRLYLGVLDDAGALQQVTTPAVVATLPDTSTVTFNTGWQPDGQGGWMLTLPLDMAGGWSLALSCASHSGLSQTVALVVKDAAGVDANGVTPPTGGRGVRGWLAGIYSRLGGTLNVNVVSGGGGGGVTGAALDGTDATGVTPPSGAVGIRGWLSGIYNRLGGTLAVAGVSAVGVAPAAAPVSVSGVDGGGLKRHLLTGTDGTLAVSAASLPLPSNAAQDGTDASGVSAPSGGAGIRGWLSGIYSRLAKGQGAKTASLSVALASDDDLVVRVGEVQANPTANTVLDRLKTIAANALAPVLQAGENFVGAVGGRQSGPVWVTPTVTATTYTSGKVIGGRMTFSAVSRGNDRTAYAIQAMVTSKGALGACDLILFGADPSASTIGDNVTFAVAAADLAKIDGVIHLTDQTSLGTPQLLQAIGITVPIKPISGTANLYGVLVARASITLTSTSDIACGLSTAQD